MALTHTPQEMFVNLDYGVNTPATSGRIDAVAHTGKLLNGEYTDDYLADVQATILDPADSDPEYVKGYEEAWNAIFNLIYGVADNRLHATLGPIT